MIEGIIGGLVGGLVTVGGVLAYLIYSGRRNENSEDFEPETEPESAPLEEEKSSSNIQFVVDTLRNMQCTPEIQEESEGVFTVGFEYQSEHFDLRVSHTSKFVALFDAFWYRFDANDIEKLGAVRRIINDINWQAQLNVCYTKSDDGNTFNVHTQTMFVYLEGDIFADYLNHLLRECFVVHNHFYRMLAQSSINSEE